jgi:UDP-glucuronate 4-epimerase
LLAAGHQVTGLDNLNDYYEVNLKFARLALLESEERFDFRRLDLADRNGMASLFAEETFDIVLNMGAQAGVRYSLVNPHAYTESNVTGFLNILEGCRVSGVGHLVYASSSSVYGANTEMPFSVHQNVDHPVSLYAASKKANELMAYRLQVCASLQFTGLGAGLTWRFFFLPVPSLQGSRLMFLIMV